MTEHWLTVDVNPDPWAIGPLGIGKRNGKFFPYVGQNAQLAAYKQAIIESLGEIEKMPEGDYELHFYFWRRLDGTSRNKKHQADATNLQKATEDALQGVLFDNDRNVKFVASTIVEQGPEVTPMIVVHARLYEGFDPDVIPEFIWDQIDQIDQIETPTLFDSNEWTGPS